tara:strand:- start:445 stop:1857 length:1413 start_codon:yes stop_codon:yes gene_type:complete
MRSLRRRNQGFSAISNPTNPEEELTQAQKNQLKQMPKYEEARDFLSRLYKTDYVRGKIKDHLAYAPFKYTFETSPDEKLSKYGPQWRRENDPAMGAYQDYFYALQDENEYGARPGAYGSNEKLWEFLRLNSDDSQERDYDNPFHTPYAYDVKAPEENYPDWMRAVVFPEMARRWREEESFDRPSRERPDYHYDMEPEAMYFNREAMLMLAQAYPERFDLGEFVTYEGIADGIADLMGDNAASLANIDFASDDADSAGYVDRTDYKSMSSDDRRFYREEEEAGSDIRRPAGLMAKHPDMGQPRTTDEYGRTKGIPYIMGLGGAMARANTAIQVDPDADMGTYVHELSHAGDAALEGLPFNSDAIRHEAYNYDDIKDDLSPIETGYLMHPRDLYRYLSRPTETLARLNAIRYAANQMYGDDSFNLDYNSPQGYRLFDYLNDAEYGTPGRHGLSDLRLIMSDESIKRLLNEVY